MTPFAIALLASLGLTPAVRRLALRLGFVDRPGPRKLHSTPTPLLGGLAIYLSVMLAILLSAAVNGGILGGATLLLVVGMLDDRGLLHHQVKLFLAMPAAAIFLVASGVRAGIVSTFWPGSTGLILDTALTILWVVGITAAFSILDHMDGLCAGVAAVAAAFFLVLSVSRGQAPRAALAAGILGAAVGFLCWNFHPARIFMGDGGAMFLGFTMAALGLELRSPDSSPSLHGMTATLVLAVPIFDTTLVSISRARRGLIPFASPGKDHTAHRLANWGLGIRGAVLTLYSLGCVCGMSALLLNRLPIVPGLALTALLVASAIPAVFALEHAPYERQKKAETLRTG
jgi:UDP-GlcNAc:undecaprenyl-phosphate GlcNAc-1-phosphate transferase